MTSSQQTSPPQRGGPKAEWQDIVETKPQIALTSAVHTERTTSTLAQPGIYGYGSEELGKLEELEEMGIAAGGWRTCQQHCDNDYDVDFVNNQTLNPKDAADDVVSRRQ